MSKEIAMNLFRGRRGLLCSTWETYISERLKYLKHKCTKIYIFIFTDQSKILVSLCECPWKKFEEVQISEREEKLFFRFSFHLYYLD